jgi:hypothetical protein
MPFGDRLARPDADTQPSPDRKFRGVEPQCRGKPSDAA